MYMEYSGVYGLKNHATFCPMHLGHTCSLDSVWANDGTFRWYSTRSFWPTSAPHTVTGLKYRGTTTRLKICTLSYSLGYIMHSLQPVGANLINQNDSKVNTNMRTCTPKKMLGRGGLSFWSVRNNMSILLKHFVSLLFKMQMEASFHEFVDFYFWPE